MSRAWIGEETEPWRVALCSYAPAPGEPHCTRDATWHGAQLDASADGDIVTVPSCDEHLPIMRGLVDCVHPYVHPCGIPGTEFRWPENRCFAEWDDRSEFAQVAESAGAA